MILLLRMGGMYCFEKNKYYFFSRNYFSVLIVSIVWSDQVDSLLLVLIDRSDIYVLFQVTSCILPVGYIWWMNLRDVLSSAWGNLLMMFCCDSHTIEFIVIVDHFYFFIMKSLCCLMWWSFLLFVSLLLTDTAKGIELTWLLMGIVVELVAIWSASIFNLAYIDKLLLSIMLSWWL